MSEALLARISEAVKEEFGAECEVRLHKTSKNNGVTLQAVLIHEPGAKATPAVYVDGLLDSVSAGRKSVREAAQEIVRTHRKHRDKFDFSDIIGRLNKRGVLDMVTYKLVNAERNRERLQDIPHREFLDLAATYVAVSGGEENGFPSVTITNSMCEGLGISSGELEAAARRNAEAQGFEISTMASIIATLTGEPEEQFDLPFPLYVLRSHAMVNGASILLCEGCFRRLADELGDDLYIIPSSVHEVIAVPAGNQELEKIREIVWSVNRTEISETEYLSDSVYRHSRTGGISIA